MTDLVLVTGAGGLLGREALRAFADAGHAVFGLGHADLDVGDEAAVYEQVRAHGASLVVHCAAVTDVDRCESDPELAWAVNARGSGNVARAAARWGCDLVAISTDYVFDGTKGGPYTEQDEPKPVQEYGRSKLGGEDAVREATRRHWVVRSAWVYGRGGKNFISKLPSIAAGGGPISAVGDQTGSPTYARDLAAALVALAEARPPYGTYHATNSGVCTFAELVRYVVDAAGTHADVREVSWRDLGLAAERPADTSLANEAWERAGLEPLRHWREAVADFVSEAG